MRLTDVMRGVVVKEWQGSREAEVSGLAYESRKVGRGSIFCTWKGKKSDGHAFVSEAVERGAVAVVAEKKTVDAVIPRIRVENGRRALGRMAANFYGNPSRELRVIGVTGTNGKTSTAMLLQCLFEGAGLRCGFMGTIGNDLGKGRQPAKQTTPEALDLQAMLAEMRENGCRAASIEVSSHALDQGRTEGVNFAGGIFTNLGRDHLDYHGNLAAYESAKGKLFEGLEEGAFAVIHQEDPAGVRMMARRFSRVCPSMRSKAGSSAAKRAWLYSCRPTHE
ncbi:MAG: UDP-N-acetylmuramoyl-L-alanyl-D-glutamate--2,6-diaminopimelate ligase, partial [Verrucomicrobia bacterium]|nr:UDP-N-acetylmuramoyl-L-alanyl-D-glutamate--2,6-diaminopimelate ligase [Verrucomicrobiota bacterium]